MVTMTLTNGAPDGTVGGAIDGVLFDFSGTLLRIEPAERWLRASLAAFHAVPGTAPCPLTDDEIARLAGALERAGALPGGGPPTSVPETLRPLWDLRDRDARSHRALYTGLARQVPLPHAELYVPPNTAPSLYDALYERHRLPDAWLPYPDAAEVLAALHDRGIRVGLLSNIGWTSARSCVPTASTATSAPACCPMSTVCRSRTRACSRSPARSWEWLRRGS